jgi:CRISPR-associated Cas5-like protein
MQGLLFQISGRYAHFKKPDTNNNPLTHDFITKTALLGLVGAVLGMERDAMREKFPQWSEDFLYGVQINGAVKKESWSFTLRSASNPNSKAPKPLEFLKEPDFTVALALKNETSRESFERFSAALQNQRAHFTPVLGLHNCPANLQWTSDGEWQSGDGEYSTRGFALRSQRYKFGGQFRVGFERIPTFQDNDFWNLPDRYQEVIYPDDGGTLAMTGAHWEYSDGSAWCLI